MALVHAPAPTVPAPTLATTTDPLAAVQPALREAVAELAEPVRQVASYHFGWITPDGRPANGASGKLMRAALVLRGAQATGAEPEVGMPGAVAVELVHNSTLLQDDVMDRDQTRRHRPTAWTIYGASEALLAGDALVVLGLRLLLRNGGPHAAPAADLLADSYQRLIVGQALDIGFESRPTVALDDCYDMVVGKTAALLACASQLGAVLAGAGPATVDALGQFGHHIGVAFQLVDDILGIWGDPARTGKPVGADIHVRKKSLPVAYALATAVGGPIAGYYASTDPPTAHKVAEVTAALTALGARGWAEAEAQRHLGAAVTSLDRADLRLDGRSHLVDLARRVVTRTS